MAACRRGLSGQALIEFAAVLPIMLLIMFAIVDGSALIRTSMTCRTAAEEGARILAQEKGGITADALSARIASSVSGSDAEGMTIETQAVSDEALAYTMEVPDSGKPGLATTRRMASTRVVCTKPCKLLSAGLFGMDRIVVTESAISTCTVKG